MQAIGIRKRWQAVNSDVYSRRPLVLRWAVAPWLSRAAVSRLGKRRESQSIYRLERDRCSEAANNAIFFRSASMKGGWIIPAGSFLLKIMHIYECSSMILGAITECFIPAEGYFSFWLRVISTILPLFRSPLKPSLFPPNSLFESWYLGSKRAKHFFFLPPDHFLSSPEAASTLDHLSPLLSLSSLPRQWTFSS